MLHTIRYARRSSARARTFDSQLLTAVARGTLITSRYWPSRNIFALMNTLDGARTRRRDYRASVEALVSPVVFRRNRTVQCRISTDVFYRVSLELNRGTERADVARELARFSAHAPDSGAELERKSDLARVKSHLFL